METARFADQDFDLTDNVPATGTVTIDDTTPTEDQVLTATAVLADLNGPLTITPTLTWQVETAANTWVNITGATGPTFTPVDAQVGKRLRVAATFTDGAGHPEQVNSAATTAVLNVNDVPVGLPTTNRPLPQEGELITASSALVSDADGMAGVTLRYRWQQRLNAGAFTNIVGATSTTFRPTQSEVGRSLRVVLTFTDNHGTVESVNSAPTGVVGDVFVGTAGADLFAGTAGRDVVSGLAGNDTLNGLAADDVLTGGADNDALNGGADNDLFPVSVGDGFDAVTGGAGTDTIAAQANNTVIGLTALTAGANATEVITANGKTGVTIAADDNGRTLNFGAVTLTNINSINGGNGGDTLTGSTIADVINGGAGIDSLNGGAGNDTITGGTDDDTVNGAAGDDLIKVTVGDGFDAVTGGTEIDTIAAQANNTVIGLRSIASTEAITANGFTGVMIAGDGGNNTLNFNAVTMTDIDRIEGGGGADIITGTGLADAILGGLGADTLNSGAGDDTITGGADNDTMNGGGGLDTFKFAAGFGADTIAGFDANSTGGQDLLDISALGITAVTFGANVTLAAGPVAGSTLVTVVGVGTIQVNGVAFPGTVANQITSADFILAP